MGRIPSLKTICPGGATEEDGKWPYSGTAGAIEAMGGVHVVTTVDQCHVDSKHKVRPVSFSTLLQLIRLMALELERS